MTMRRQIGITSTIPIEVVYASDSVAVDLNNTFIEADNSLSLIEKAERRGFPEASCAWIKGIYSSVHSSRVDAVIAVLQGDCSNTHALMETLEMEGVATVPFMYPYDRDRDFLRFQLDKLRRSFGVTDEEMMSTKRELDAIRSKAEEIDRLTWQEGLVSGFENHYFQISCSDMRSDPSRFGKEMDDFLAAVPKRTRKDCDLRLGYVGIPPIVTGLYQFIESQGGGVVFNELQRQFRMPHLCEDMVDQYLMYTYPYHIRFRLEDIKREIKRRDIDGVIHYVQAFCFRQIEDIIVRKALDLPVLTIEGNRPGKLDLRTKIRIEAFLDMLRSR
jgi:benzoyl-CoA reductase/2-hydroxyglutaryl-CoA dehydratase subunit BcrC/BadD/HgdB